MHFDDATSRSPALLPPLPLRLDLGKWLQLAEAAPEAPQPRQGGAESLSLSQSLLVKTRRIAASSHRVAQKSIPEN